jgi:peroxiredoxin
MCQFITRRKGLRGALMLMAATAVGCGGSDAPPSAAEHGAAHGKTSPSQSAPPDPIPPVAAISAPQTAEMTSSPDRPTAEPGSPAAKLQQIADLVAAANAQARQLQVDEAAGNEDSPAAQAYRDHLLQVIELATQVIAQTHLDPQAEQSFNTAVHFLSDARLELASAGDAEQARLLLEDADSLYERDRESLAAAESGFKVVALAERMARSLGSADREWLTEYASQANQFAERFPEQKSRAALALFTAGRLCDRFQLTDQARQCLERVQSQFAGTAAAEQSAGILRRLSLQGQSLELTGPTIDGGVVDINHYRTDVVLVVFWATTSPTFREQLPAIQQIEAELASRNFSIIGINLDRDEAAVDAFLTEHSLAWPQVFSADPEQRAGRNPVARYYGVQVLPTYWLVAPGGVVLSVQPDVETLREAIVALLPRR